MRTMGYVGLALVAAGCSSLHGVSRKPKVETTTTTVVEVETAEAGGAVSQRIDKDVREALARAPRAVKLRATTDTLRLRVGESVAAGSFPIVMVDAGGVDLGPLPFYDMENGPDAVYELSDTGIRGEMAGVSPLTVAIPEPLRPGQSGPAPSVVIQVKVSD